MWWNKKAQPTAGKPAGTLCPEHSGRSSSGAAAACPLDTSVCPGQLELRPEIPVAVTSSAVLPGTSGDGEKTIKLILSLNAGPDVIP